jgi:hypothetical protein
VDQSGNNLLKVGLPVFTFVLGLLYSQYEKRRAQKLAIRNVQMMVMLEMTENLRRLCLLLPVRRDCDMRYANFFAENFGRVRMEIHKVYLNKMDQLPPKTLIPLYLAYNTIDRFNDRIGKYSAQLKRDKEFAEKEEEACAVLKAGFDTVDDIRKALLTMDIPEADINGFESERGVTYIAFMKRINELSDTPG